MAFLGIYFGENGIKKLELQFLYLFIDHDFPFLRHSWFGKKCG